MPFTLSWRLDALPQVVTAGRFPLSDQAFSTLYRGRIHALHLHDYSGSMLLDGVRLALAPDDVTISPAGRPSAYDLAAPGRHWCIHFAPVELQGESVALPLHLSAGAAAGHLRERFARIASLHARAAESPIAQASASLSCQELLLWLADHGSASDGIPSPAERAAALINERFDEPLSVSEIARAVGRSQAHLARAFRARYGTTLPHRLIARRMEHARYLLESTDLPIWRVAERVGIPDAQHFNKTVRRLLGESPSTIRARAAYAPIDPDR